jgi:hypothetical protein
MPDVKVTTQDYREMKEFCLQFYSFTETKMDENSKKRTEQGKKAYALFKAAHGKFYEEYHWFSPKVGNEGNVELEEAAAHYRNFVDGLWDIHNGDEALEEVSPARWVQMWEIEAACKEAFGEHWKERYK